MEHGEGAIYDGHKMLAERLVDGGCDEFFVGVKGVPVCVGIGR